MQRKFLGMSNTNEGESVPLRECQQYLTHSRPIRLRRHRPNSSERHYDRHDQARPAVRRRAQELPALSDVCRTSGGCPAIPDCGCTAEGQHVLEDLADDSRRDLPLRRTSQTRSPVHHASTHGADSDRNRIIGRPKPLARPAGRVSSTTGLPTTPPTSPGTKARSGRMATRSRRSTRSPAPSKVSSKRTTRTTTPPRSSTLTGRRTTPTTRCTLTRRLAVSRPKPPLT